VSKRIIMTDRSSVEDNVPYGGTTISFGERFQASQFFDQVFKEGMALVERTAAYLDGDGRRDSKSLPGNVTVLYTTESMRLTTRLLDLASWLLIRRALKDGEITEEEAQRKRQRVKLQNLGRPSHIRGFAELPQGLRGLIEESFGLHDRIVQLDLAMSRKPDADDIAVVTVNPVEVQMRRLERAFGGKAN
jgi:regulator of CtrA degradation